MIENKQRAERYGRLKKKWNSLDYIIKELFTLAYHLLPEPLAEPVCHCTTRFEVVSNLDLYFMIKVPLYLVEFRNSGESVVQCTDIMCLRALAQPFSK